MAWKEGGMMDGWMDGWLEWVGGMEGAWHDGWVGGSVRAWVSVQANR